MFLGEENVVSLMIQNGTNVLRVKGTVTLMQVVLEVLSVDVTTAGSIIRTPHLRMTAARPAEAKGVLIISLARRLQSNIKQTYFYDKTRFYCSPNQAKFNTI